MKTVKLVFSIIPMMLLSLACNDETKGVCPLPCSEVVYTSLEVHADITEPEVPIRIVQGANLVLTGHTTTCNLAENTIFNLAGEVSYLDEYGQFEIRTGEFILSAQETGCELNGDFSGTGVKYYDGFEFYGTIEIAYGYGGFKADGGTLNLRLVARLDTKNEDYNYVLDISGDLMRYIKS